MLRHVALRMRTRKRSILLILILTFISAIFLCKLSLTPSESPKPEPDSASPITKPNATVTTNATSTAERAEFVRQMTKHAWQTYAHVALGQNEFRPISNQSISPDMFGHGSSLGVFLIDSLDTLLLMGYDEEVDAAMSWLRYNFHPSRVVGFVNVFEVNIRVLGGLLGAYTTCKKHDHKNLLLKLAQNMGDRLLAAYDDNNLAHSLVNLNTGRKDMHHWTTNCIILSEAGTIQLEMDYLSKLTGDERYATKARLGTKALLDRFTGNNYIEISKGVHCRKHMSMGALGDSFYEYLLKVDILSPNGSVPEHARFEAFLNSMQTVEERILRDSDPNNTYFGEHYETFVPTMSHLACFSGGMYALAAMAGASPSPDELARHERLARNITYTCRRSYLMGNGLGPEAFQMTPNGEIQRHMHTYSILRPEYVESLFYLYRLTGEEKYREWAWDVVLAIEKRCKVPGGYSGIKNVFANIDVHDDLQQTFFIAETLKYLYLIFSNSNLLPLDQYVLNTEAHPFRV